MSDDYTPTTGEVRADFVALHTRNFDAYAAGRSLTSEQEYYGEDFDRWLTAHDAEVAERIAQAIEGELRAEQTQGIPQHPYHNGGMRRAARIAREAGK